MNPQPVLEGERLRLRPLTIDDVGEVARLAGRREIASTTSSIPHPYSEELAREWIETRTGNDLGVVYAVTLKSHCGFVGTIGLRLDPENAQAEMGFWIDVDCWGKGYATEAGKLILRLAFEDLQLNRVYARHMARNPASGKVLAKIGMKHEGVLRQAMKKWGVFEDMVQLAILRQDWPGT